MLEKQFVPMDVDDAQIAFGGGDLIPYGDWAGSDFMPSGDDIPAEFKTYNHRGWNGVVSTWFYKGLPEDVKFFPKKGIDTQKALNHVGTIMRSWTPKHEHKEAACAYLLSLWFKDVRAGGKSLLNK